MPVKSENGDKFRYNGYWGTHSRVLREPEGDKSQVEVTVFPSNHNFPYAWIEIAELRIRSHRTAPGASDRTYDELDDELQIQTRVTPEIANVLIHDDILSEIDNDKWDEVRRKWRGGGGIPFILICKDPSKYLFLVEPWLDAEGARKAGVYPGDELLFDPVLKLYKESKMEKDTK